MARPPSGHAESPPRDFVLKDFGGVNTQSDATSISDEEFSWLENLIPIGHGNMRAVYGPSAALVTMPSAIVAWQYVNLNNTDQVMVFLASGAAYSYNMASTVTLVASAGTFTGTPRCAQWQNAYALIIASNGYWSWDGTTLIQLNGQLQAFTVSQYGSGYTSVPGVTFTGGGGSGASATAVVGLVHAVLAAAGTGYSVNDVLTLSGGTSTVAATITVSTVNASTGAITAFAISNPGNYTVMPTSPVSTTGGFGTGATVTATWGVSSITLTAPGSNYTSSPTIGFTGGGGGSGTVATVSLSAAPSAGTDIATYAGHVWIAYRRNLIYSAPGSYTDFTIANGGGTTIITDESLHSYLTGLCANNNYLYVFSANSINVISNVTISASGPTAGLTVFSNNNLTASVGTSYSASLVIYDRSVLFSDSHGFYGVFGATTKKASEKIDGTFPYINTAKPITGGLAMLYNNVVPMFLFQYQDPTLAGQQRSLLAGLRDGKWFFASQGLTLTSMVGAYSGDQPLLFATDGTNIYQLFSNASASIATSFTTCLSDMGHPYVTKQSTKLGVEVYSAAALNGVAQVVTELGASSAVSQSSNLITWINNTGASVSWTNALGATVAWAPTGRQLFQGNVETYGRYIGAQWSSSNPAYIINGVMIRFFDRAQWGSVPGA